jgi:hypothetical protein
MKLGMGIGVNSHRIAGGSVGLQTADPSVRLLLHLDSDYFDGSIYANFPTLVGTPSIDTVEKVFGAGSMDLAPVDRVVYPASTDWLIADGIPWQMNLRMFSATGRAGSLESLFSTGDWNGGGFEFFSDGGWTALKLASTGGFRATWNYVFPLDTWTTHRVNYDGAGNYRWYVDAVLLGVQTPVGILDATLPLSIGGRPSGDGFTGKIDEVRWEKDPSLVVTTAPTYEVETEPYSGTFKHLLPPVNPPSMAKLLLHFDTDFSDSSLANKTPTLTGTPSIDTGEKVFGTGSLSRMPDDRVTYPASADWFIADSIPWQLSFRLFSKTGRASSQETFFSNAGWGPGFMLRSEQSWNQVQLASNGFGGSNPKWSYVFPLDIWTYHRINHDGAGNYRWYVDGILLGVEVPTGFVDTNAPLIIGRRPDHTDGFTGNMDEIKWEKDPALVVTTTQTYEVETVAFPDP